MKYFKEVISSNHFNRSKDGERILLENICVVLDMKIVIQELNVDYTVPVDSTSTHGNDILAAATSIRVYLLHMKSLIFNKFTSGILHSVLHLMK